jgi:hypothetical protein
MFKVGDKVFLPTQNKWVLEIIKAPKEEMGTYKVKVLKGPGYKPDQETTTTLIGWERIKPVRKHHPLTKIFQ